MAKKKDDKADPKTPKRVEVLETIDVKLSDHERIERAVAHATALNEIDLMKPRHESEKKRMKLEQSNAEAKERGLRTICETGMEPRQIKCWIDFNWSTGKAITRRMETDEEVSSREIFESERQTNIGTMRAEMEKKGLLANAPDGAPIVGTPQGRDFFEKVGAEVIKIDRANANAKNVEEGENVTVPPDALDEENDAAE